MEFSSRRLAVGGHPRSVTGRGLRGGGMCCIVLLHGVG